jgi:hypothetical protein
MSHIGPNGCIGLDNNQRLYELCHRTTRGTALSQVSCRFTMLLGEPALRAQTVILPA